MEIMRRRCLAGGTSHSHLDNVSYSGVRVDLQEGAIVCILE